MMATTITTATNSHQVEMISTSSSSLVPQHLWNTNSSSATSYSSPQTTGRFDKSAASDSASKPATTGFPTTTLAEGGGVDDDDDGDSDCMSSSYTDSTMAKEAGAGNCTQEDENGVSPLIVFDWDDTMLTSSWIQSRELLQAGSYEDLPAEAQRDLGRLEQSVIKCLTNARRNGTVIIITNAESGWVELSAAKFFVHVLPLLEGVPVVSARSLFEAQFPGSPLCWKSAAFAYMMHDHFLDLPRWVPKMVLSVGDSNEEKVAMRIASGQHTSMTAKAVKFVAGPDPEALASQLDIVTAHLEWIISREGDAELILSPAMINGSDCNSLPMMRQQDQRHGSSLGAPGQHHNNGYASSSAETPQGSVSPRSPASQQHDQQQEGLRPSSTSCVSHNLRQSSSTFVATSSPSKLAAGSALQDTVATSGPKPRRSSCPIPIPYQSTVRADESQTQREGNENSSNGVSGGVSLMDSSGGGSSAPAPHPSWLGDSNNNSSPNHRRKLTPATPSAIGNTKAALVNCQEHTIDNTPTSTLSFRTTTMASSFPSVASLKSGTISTAPENTIVANYEDEDDDDQSGGSPGGVGGGGGSEADRSTAGGGGGPGLLPLGTGSASGRSSAVAEGSGLSTGGDDMVGFGGPVRTMRASAPMA